ncbi:MAG TPA: tyrosine-type recombinase/integrase, partial [Micromonosporaceae bacterium]
ILTELLLSADSSRRACHRSGTHDLRHTMVTLLLDLGVPPHLVQAIARHPHVDITLKIYAHTNLDAMREAVKPLDDQLD